MVYHLRCPNHCKRADNHSSRAGHTESELQDAQPTTATPYRSGVADAVPTLAGHRPPEESVRDFQADGYTSFSNQ